MDGTVDLTGGAPLLGVDIGIKPEKRSTGLAWRIGGPIGTALTKRDWAQRRTVLPEGVTFEVALIDGPILHSSEVRHRRACEATFIGKPFTKRCQPGYSDYGQGLEFREAGRETFHQFAAVVASGGIHETFPSGFLGVMLPENSFDRAPLFGVRRAKRSDRIYEVALEEGVIARMLAQIGWDDAATMRRFSEERDHDIRMALVCMTAAGFVRARLASSVGDPVGGWFWMPPPDLWAAWAREGVKHNIEVRRQEGHQGLVWNKPTQSSARAL